MANATHAPGTNGCNPLLRLVHSLRAVFAPTPAQAQAELLRLMIRAGRRCAHNLAHAADEVRDHESALMWKERARLWEGIFYPAGGPKDYRDELHTELRLKQGEIDRLRALCLRHGINPDSNSSATPF